MMFVFRVMLLIAAFGGSSTAGVIRKAVLDYDQENVLRISKNEPLTVIFPFALYAGSVAGGSITSNPEKIPAAFYLSYNEGSQAVVLRALKEGETTTINLLTADNRVAVVKLVAAEGINDSAVTFRHRGDGGAQTFDYNPVRMSAYLERTFLYPLLKKAKSNLIDHSEEFGYETESAFPNGTKFILESAVRWKDPHPRCVVFNGRLVNETSHDIDYDRNSLSMKIGENQYRANISHAAGLVKANSTQPIQFAISEGDYPDITAIDLKRNRIDLTVSFEKPEETPIGVLPELGTLPLPSSSK